MTYTQERKQSMETNAKMTQMLTSADRDFKAANWCAQGQKGKYACSKWKDKTFQQRSRNYTSYRKILELKTTTAEVLKLLDELNRLAMTEESIG